MSMHPLDPFRGHETAIAVICAQHQVAELAVFGSVARGEAGPESDLDLLVTFRPDAVVGLLAFNRLRRELETALERTVDLVPKDGLKPLVRRGVLAEARVLYAA